MQKQKADAEAADESAEAAADAEGSDESAEAVADAEGSDESAEADTGAEAAEDAQKMNPAEAAEPKTSEIAFADLMVGDIVKINFDEDGAAAAVTVVTPADMNTLENAITVELAEEDADAAEAGTESVTEAE